MSEFQRILKIKNSDITGRAPTDLESGELAINNFDGRLFFRDAQTNGINSIDLLTKGLTLENYLNFEKEVRDYRNSKVSDIIAANWTVEQLSTAVPPYKNNFSYYSECSYIPTSETINKKKNISSVEKLATGYYKFNFISSFPDTDYEVVIDIPKFETTTETNNGETVYSVAGTEPFFSSIAEKNINYVLILTAKAVNSLDENQNVAVLAHEHDLNYLNIKCVL